MKLDHLLEDSNKETLDGVKEDFELFALADTKRFGLGFDVRETATSVILGLTYEISDKIEADNRNRVELPYLMFSNDSEFPEPFRVASWNHQSKIVPPRYFKSASQAHAAMVFIMRQQLKVAGIIKEESSGELTSAGTWKHALRVLGQHDELNVIDCVTSATVTIALAAFFNEHMRADIKDAHSGNYEELFDKVNKDRKLLDLFVEHMGNKLVKLQPLISVKVRKAFDMCIAKYVDLADVKEDLELLGAALAKIYDTDYKIVVKDGHVDLRVDVETDKDGVEPYITYSLNTFRLEFITDLRRTQVLPRYFLTAGQLSKVAVEYAKRFKDAK
jgi:hypothetical protein